MAEEITREKKGKEESITKQNMYYTTAEPVFYKKLNVSCEYNRLNG